MCDPVLIAAIVEELGHLDKKEEKDNKVTVHEDRVSKETLQNIGEEDEK